MHRQPLMRHLHMGCGESLGTVMGSGEAGRVGRLGAFPRPTAPVSPRGVSMPKPETKVRR